MILSEKAGMLLRKVNKFLNQSVHPPKNGSEWKIKDQIFIFWMKTSQLFLPSRALFRSIKYSGDNPSLINVYPRFLDPILL